MLWSKRQDNQPNFIWHEESLLHAEWIFVSESGQTAGAARHLNSFGQSQLSVRNLKDNVLANLEIDGEILRPDRVEAALRRNLGLAFQDQCEGVAEMGASRLALHVLMDPEIPFDENILFGWQEKYEAALFPDSPHQDVALSESLRRELHSYLAWYKEMLAEEDSPLLRAGLSHIWFECIQPLPLASGVVGRILAERMLACSMPSRNLIPLSIVFNKYRHEYHAVLDEACRVRNAERWLPWFAAAAIEAGRISRARLNFAVHWGEMSKRLENRVTRQQHLLLRHLFWMGADGFLRGIGANDTEIVAGQTRRELQRNLSILVENDALARMRLGSEWRYHLNLPSPEVPRVWPEDIR